MKKDRNAFFNEANFSQSSFMGTPNMPNMNGMGNDYMSDMESRLAKIERQINRLDARVSKLESKGFVTTENFDNTTNMYML